MMEIEFCFVPPPFILFCLLLKLSQHVIVVRIAFFPFDFNPNYSVRPMKLTGFCTEKGEV